MKIGILGGTFDPIHLGHLRTAEELCEKLRLEKMYLVPSASPPHKSYEPVTPFEQRLHMARTAAGGSPLLDVLDLEGKRPGLSYSIETLREVQTLFSPSPELFFVLGIDAFLEINTWKEYESLFDYAHFVVIPRAGYQNTDLSLFLSDSGLAAKKSCEPGTFVMPSGKKLIFTSSTFMDISSTRIRGLVTTGRSIRFLVPESIHQYILQKRLYARHADPK